MAPHFARLHGSMGSETPKPRGLGFFGLGVEPESKKRKVQKPRLKKWKVPKP